MEFNQLTLPISWALSYKPCDFVVSECNEYAFEWLEKWPFKIRENFVCLVGEKGSGKTHLSRIWASRFSADFMSAHDQIFDKWVDISSNESSQKYFVLDDADEMNNEILLFYIYNTIKEKNAYLLLTAKSAPSKWNLLLADIKSRISTVNVINIKNPNEDMTCSIIEKMLLQRGITVKENVISYIANTIERSYESINYWVKQIDSNINKDHKASLQTIKTIVK